MDEEKQDVAAMFAITRAFKVLCDELHKAGVMPRSTLAEALQEDYLQERAEGRPVEFLAAYRRFAVRLGPVPGVPPLPA